MPESLLSDSSLWLFGRVMTDIVLADAKSRQAIYNPPPPGPDDQSAPPIRRSENAFLRAALGAEDAAIARIYAFSYNNGFFELGKPALFVINGPGVDPGHVPFGMYRPNSPDRTGLAHQDEAFAEDLRVWVYDRADFTVRLDIETGPLERVLLENELGGQGLEAFVRGSAHSDKPGPAGPTRRRGRWRPMDD